DVAAASEEIDRGAISPQREPRHAISGLSVRRGRGRLDNADAARVVDLAHGKVPTRVYRYRAIAHAEGAAGCTRHPIGRQRVERTGMAPGEAIASEFRSRQSTESAGFQVDITAKIDELVAAGADETSAHIEVAATGLGQAAVGEHSAAGADCNNDAATAIIA